ncbi:MAG: hypothetical protein AAF492_25710, partial [Verrucomicrobiota bacterium]
YRVYASNSVGEAWAPVSEMFKSPAPFQPEVEGLRVRVFDTVSSSANLAPISLLQALPEDGVATQIADIDYSGNFVGAFPGLTGGDTFSLLWEGVFIPDAGAGDYTFGLDSDDRSVLYLDLNDDGLFEPGELIVDRPCCGVAVQIATLENRPYNIAIGFQEGGGGERIRARWKAGIHININDLDLIDGTSGAFYFPGTTGLEIQNLSATLVTDNSAVLNAELTSPESIFAVDVFWGDNDGGTNALNWDNRQSLGAFTNVALTNIMTQVSGLVPDTELFFTFPSIS